MSTTVAVVIPVYREELTPLERISLAQVRRVLGNCPLIFVAPEGKIFSYFDEGDMVAHFPPQFFRSVETYSRLLLSPDFYAAFADFDYVLIHQLDAFVFYDALEDFCALGCDYIGAPWPRIAYFSYRNKKTPRVGNGGFSLRRVAACHELLTQAAQSSTWEETLASAHEDTFFAYCGASEDIDFNVAPVEIAAQFSMEHYPARHVKRLGGKFPFGCHNWHRFSADFYVAALAQCGWDLRPLRELMGNEDYVYQLPLGLTKLALTRLIRTIERGQSLIRYLPARRFASVRVLREPDALKILAKLLTEENFLADRIFICDAADDLIRDVTRKPLLLLTTDYDAPTIEALENRGLRYGKDVVSFWREYLTYYAKLFHKLGK